MKTKRCPYCGEEILEAAKKCKHCKEWLEQDLDNVSDVVETSGNHSDFKVICVSVIIFLLVIVILLLLMNNGVRQQNDIPSNNEKTVSNNITIVSDSLPSEDPEIEEARHMLAESSNIEYYNGRYDFSIFYPDCFKMGVESQSGDGCSFSLKYGIKFSVWGDYNNIDFYGKDIKEYYQKDEDRASATYHDQKDNWFVMSGKLDNDMMYYKKVVFMDGYADDGAYATFYLKFPKKFDDVLADFIRYEAKNFNPIYNKRDSQNTQKEELKGPLDNQQVHFQKRTEAKIETGDYTRDQQTALFLGLMLSAALFESDEDVSERQREDEEWEERRRREQDEREQYDREHYFFLKDKENK